MKTGTATKLVLNTITNGSMVLLGVGREEAILLLNGAEGFVSRVAGDLL